MNAYHLAALPWVLLLIAVPSLWPWVLLGASVLTAAVAVPLAWRYRVLLDRARLERDQAELERDIAQELLRFRRPVLRVVDGGDTA